MIRQEYATGEHEVKINMIPRPTTSDTAFIHMIAGETNPSTGVDEFEIHDYWNCPSAFYTEFVGRNNSWDDNYIRGEVGGLKRHIVHLMMVGEETVGVMPFSILIVIENLQRYYTDKILALQERLKCLEQPSTSSTPE